MLSPNKTAAANQNRVPEVTLDFWLIKLMAVTMGETAADYLAVNLGLGLTVTSLIMTGVLIVALGLQFAQKRYVPWAYWLAILFTFSLGTAAGDLVAESFDMGYLTSGLMFGGVIALIALAYYLIHLDAILAFWLAYILTRPLGASFGDLLSQPAEYGGLGFGTTFTSLIFLGCIAALVLYMTLKKTAGGADEILLESD